MSEQKLAPETAPRRGLSLDTFAVAIALVLALLIRFHVIRSVPW